MVLACRDEAAGRGAAQVLGCKSVVLDTSCPASRQTLPGRVACALGVAEGALRVDLLINHAAVYRDGWSEANYAAHLAANFEGPVGVVDALRPHLAPGGRIVNVSSGYGARSELPEHALGPKIWAAATPEQLLAVGRALFSDVSERGGRAYVAAYKIRKCLLNSYTLLLRGDPALLAAGVTTVAMCPGWCSTRMGGAAAGRTQAEGAASVLAVALAPEGATLPAFSCDGKRLDNWDT